MAVSALRFLYHVTLKQDRVIEMIPYPKQEYQLPEILSRAYRSADSQKYCAREWHQPRLVAQMR